MTSRQPDQDEEKQEDIGGMEEEVHGVKGRWIGTKQVPVQHERHPRERMPIAVVKRGEGPEGPLPREPQRDIGIYQNVVVIVVIDELSLSNPPKGKEGEKNENGRAGISGKSGP